MSAGELGERALDELAQHQRALEHGRVLLRAKESLIAFDAPFLLACRSEGAVLELAIFRVTAFAFLLSGVIGTLVALRAAPPHIGAVVAVWLVGSVVARVFVRRRRGEHGRILLDFEAMSLHARTLAGTEYRLPLSECRIRTELSEDGEAPVWIILFSTTDEGKGPKQLKLRLGRGAEHEVDRVLTVLRSHHVAVERWDAGVAT
ncbi:MAG: hypothetical protein HOW73_00140 [Polyangiaceae bacterium]|nr:hypothetical protein [Polyangiaceae bacterium]